MTLADRTAAVVVLLIFLTVSGCGDGSGTTGPEPESVFTNPSDCPLSGVAASDSQRRKTAPEGVEGTFVVTEKGSGETAAESCPDPKVFPPADGPIASTWANCGFYDEPVSPPHAVHSLYNGAVWIAYEPGLDARSLDVIRATATRASHVLASPVEGMKAPIVLSAWQRQLWLDDVHDPRFDEFVTAYLHAPDRPVVYQPCRDGQGHPAQSFWDEAGS